MANETGQGFDGLSVVLVGQTFPASRTVQRIHALRQLGTELSIVPTVVAGKDYDTPPTLSERIRYRLRRPLDAAKANEGLLNAVGAETKVLWLDAADVIRLETLVSARQIARDLRVIWYSEDDLMNSKLRTIWLEQSIPEIDLWVTTKSFNTLAGEIPSLGVKRMLFVNNSYDPIVHRHVADPTESEQSLGSDICFVGTYEEPRAKSILGLAEAGLHVRVWGNGWHKLQSQHENVEIMGRAAYNDEYAAVISTSKVNLCFLRHANRDLQTCRSIEIPAAAGFMIHERNEEITGLFREDEEAVFFSNDEELIEKCRQWLDNDDKRQKVAQKGLDRTRELKLDHCSNVRRILADSLGHRAEHQS